MIAFIMTIDNPMEKTKMQRIFELHKDDIYYIAYGKLKDHHMAEDMVQNVIIRLYKYKYIKSLDINDVELDNTRYYIARATINICNDYLMRNNVKGLNMMSDTPIDDYQNLYNLADLLEEGFLLKEVMQEINEILPIMKDSYSEIIKLRYYDELSTTEIAEMLNISKTNVSSKLNRAINKLKKIYNERNENNVKP